MAIFTSAELDAQLTAWKAALTALSTSKEYSIGSRRLRREDLSEVRSTLEWLEGERAKAGLTDGCRRVHTTPVGDSW
jgi:hypothetical protein